jgi:hypothetical protein
MIISKTWEEIKQLSVDKALMIKFNESSIDYQIFVVENGITFSTTLIKNETDPEVIDFETNYKEKVNLPDYSSMTLSWSEFKMYADIQIVGNRLFYRGDGNIVPYYLWTRLEGVFIQCYLSKSSTDQIDFETNYLSLCNKPSVTVPTFANYNDKRYGTEGFSIVCVPPSEIDAPLDFHITDQYIEIPKGVVLFGGEYSILQDVSVVDIRDYLEIYICIMVAPGIYVTLGKPIAKTRRTKFFPRGVIKRTDTAAVVSVDNIFLRVKYCCFLLYKLI